MANPKTAPRMPARSRGKALLIGALSIVLVVVLYVQFGRRAGGSETVDAETASTPVPTPKLPSADKAATAEPSPEPEAEMRAALLEFDQARWKPPELSKVVAYDPFALPAGFPRPSPLGGLAVAEADAATAEESSKQLAEALAELRMQLDELKERGVHVIVGQKDQYVAMIGDRKVHVGDEINGFTVIKIDPKEGVRVEWRGSQ